MGRPSARLSPHPGQPKRPASTTTLGRGAPHQRGRPCGDPGETRSDHDKSLNSNSLFRSSTTICYNRGVAEPTILPRSKHVLSRREIDPDALKVLYRLHRHGFSAYLVGGSVRDLLLRRRPKDFDIGTSAHPYQVKRLFRNCWVIGRRFRLAHVRFGTKTIEVATFRRKLPAGTEGEPPLGVSSAQAGEPSPPVARPTGRPQDLASGIVRRDNTFGTPEEDAFRRDFTVNGLFYDIATFSIIDYVGGLGDLATRVVRSIGDPDERFQEDPVRMLRAVVLASRLDFTLDSAIPEAIRRHAPLIAQSAPARLLDEYYKILRSGAAQISFARLADSGLLDHITPDLLTGDHARLARALEALDTYRARFAQAPETLTNAILMGTLLVPLGLFGLRGPSQDDVEAPVTRTLGLLPVSRRDLERLVQVLGLQPRLLQTDRPVRAQRGLLQRGALRDALTWLELHGNQPDAVAYWHDLLVERGQARPAAGNGTEDPTWRARRRRRRRRGGRRSRPGDARN
ncbi:MAG: polynucleotide adenylyltransferase PcnB [Luteitalea sp.]|nr:polynucleotide adenylyltransferase PcnB [Luteitalea sp.]